MWRSWIRSWGLICVNINVKYEVNVNIDENFYWDVDRSVGAEVGRGDYDILYSDFFVEFVSGGCEEVELKVGDEPGSGYDSRVNKGIKVVIYVGVVGSIGSGVYRGVGSGFGSSDGITFRLYGGSDMGSLMYLFMVWIV